MSALPNSVRKQIDRANQIAEEYAKAQKAAAESSTENTTAPAASVEPTAASTEPTATPTASTAPIAPAAPAAPTDWEQRYRVLQGKYNAEVPRLQDQIKEQSFQIRQLADQLAATQRLLSTMPPQEQPQQKPSVSKLVRDEEVAEFGADLYDFVKRAAREAVVPDVDQRIANTLTPVAKKVQEVEAQVSTAARKVEETEREKVHRLLTERVPTWQQLDVDPNFIEWLDQVDPFSGQKRGTLLNVAYQRNDGPRVVAFFEGYLRENAAVTPSATTSLAADQSAPQVPLSSLTAPGAPKQGTAGAQEGAGKRIWTRPEIQKFYSDLSAGKYAKRPDDAKKIEQDIFKAQVEGRIR
jgi:hypothetical protein